VRLRTESTLANGGDALARSEDGRVIFIQGAAPNELVDVEILQTKKKFARARVSKVIEASEDRVEPKCRHFDSCGGCVSQHISAAAQTQSKQEGLMQTLRRIGKLELESVDVESPWTGPSYGYRSRARLALAPPKLVGFRAHNSNEVVDIEDCPVLTPQAQQALSDIRQLKLQCRTIEEFDLVANQERALVRLPKKFARSLKQREKPSKTDFIYGTARRSIPAQDGRGKLMLSPGVFAQSNPIGNVAMIDYITSLTTDVDHMVELYAGSGNFTRALHEKIARIEMIEGEGPAIEFAKRSLPAQIEIHEGSVEVVLEKRIQEGLRGVTLLADPPRSGLSKKVAELLRELELKSMIYVSCDPATFARDLALLSDVYRLCRLRLFDLYPHTAHTEVVGVLKPL
jgi:23S rRNA (uracil1939-C5)-methyltransferase